MRAAVGLLIGTALAIAALAAPAGRSAFVMPDQGGALREIVVQYSGIDLPDVLPVYAALFAALPPDVRVIAVVPDEAAFARLQARAGRDLVPVIVGRAITSWAKDRFLVAGNILYVPRRPIEGSAGRRNDWLAPFAIADARGFEVAPLALNFDGGDAIATDRDVFISDCLFAKNDRPADEVVALLERAFGRRVIVLTDAPAHHLGMYMMPLGDGRIVLADAFPGIRSQLEALGYGIVDVPIEVTEQRYVWRSYTNVLLDAERVYLPQYGIETDAVAREVWTSLGFEVVPIDCSAIYAHGGSLRCLVNVLDRR